MVEWKEPADVQETGNSFQSLELFRISCMESTTYE